MKLLPLLALAFATVSSPVSAANSASAQGSAQATVISPISATELSDLDFGMVATSPTRGGTVTVSAGSDRTSFTGGARNACNAQACASSHPARFAVKGEANRSYAVSLPGRVDIAGVTQDGQPAPSLSVTGLAVRTDSRPNAGPHGQLDSAGADQFGVGGLLQVPAGVEPAHYRVSLIVLVNYS